MDPNVLIKVTPFNLAFLLTFACATCPFMAAYFYGSFRLLFGTLYPAYASYKAVKTKNVKEYVKWMMYWIVFALFTSVETFTDVFLAFWFPFYYEIKIILVLWLLSPATKGSSILYRKFVHPQLTKREKDIDEYIMRAREQGYHAVLQLGSKGINYASQVLVQTALKSGNQVVSHLHRSYSLSHLEYEDSRTRSKTDEPASHLNEDHSDHADTGADEESFPLDDLSENQSNFELQGEDFSESEVTLQRQPLSQSGRGRSRKGDAPSSGYSSTENLSTLPSAGDQLGLHGRQSTRAKGGRGQASHISHQGPGKRGLQAEVGSSATLPRAAKRSTRRKNATLS